MSFLHNIAAGFRSIFHKRQSDRDLDEELRSFLDMAAEEKIKQGLPSQEALRTVRLERGTVLVSKETVRDATWESFLENSWQDLRFALRGLRKSPGFTIVVILTLALGIGANTAIFQLLDAVRMRMLPVPNPQELAAVRIVGGNHGMGRNGPFGDLTRPQWQEIRDNQHAFAGIFAWSATDAYVGRGSAMRRVHVLWVSGDFFRVLGVRPSRGRPLLPGDEGACPISYGVASYSYWRRELGGRDPASGIPLIVDDSPIRIIGVTSPDFSGMVVGDTFDIAAPFCMPSDGRRRDIFDVTVMGRLKPGWSLERASAELDALSRGIMEATVPSGYNTNVTENYKHFRLAAYPASRGVDGFSDNDYTPLWMLLGITTLVLLIACANLANLMLVRGNAREREIAVRMALGAPRLRLIRQLLSEAVLLVLAGAFFGVVLARVLSRGLVTLFSTAHHVLQLNLSIDWRVLLFVTVVAAVTCLVFALAPALRTSATRPNDALKAASRGTTADRNKFSFQGLLVVTQVALSMLLLVGALIFVRSFRNLVMLDAGMRERGITSAFLGYWQSNLPRERLLSFQQQLLKDVQSVPGVQSAATTTMVPLSGGSWSHAVRVGSVENSSKFTWVSPEYFQTMGIPILRGRGFTKEDTASSLRVAVVNQTFVRRFLNGIDPMGKTLLTIAEPGYPATTYQIVGVVPDTRYSNIRDEIPASTFAPASQFPEIASWSQLVIYSSLPSATVMATVKASLAEKHPDVLAEFDDFQKQILDGLVIERVMAMLSAFFGVLAALLAAIGIYGVISYIVAMRRNEIGIRVAMGATRSSVVALILRQTGVVLLAGLVIGLFLAFPAVSGASSLLYGLRPNDPATFIAAGALLTAISFLAASIPALRATRVNPLTALRYE